MKIAQVILENFGIYNRKVFQFNESPMVVIYGPNESGKTTALNGLRQAIFGFRPRTSYLTGQTMSASVSGTLQDGRHLEFTRRKGRPDDVQGTLDSISVNAAELRSLLCSLDLESYEHLFGFSQDELRRGQDTLKSTRLSEALAGGSLNGINSLERLRGELSNSLAELYKPRGSTSKINRKLADIRQSHEALRNTDVLPAEIEELRNKLREAYARSEDLKREQAGVNRARSQAEKRLAALPEFVTLQTAQLQLNEIELPDEIDATFLAQWGDYADQRKSLAQRVASEQEALQADQAQLKSLGGNSQLLDFELKIEQLGHQAAEVPAIRERLSNLLEAHKVAADARDGLLESLQLAQLDEAVLTFSISVPQRQELESLSGQYKVLNTERLENRARLEAARDNTEDGPSTDRDLPPDNLRNIEEYVQLLADAEQQTSRLSAKLQEGMSDPSYQELLQRLTALLPPDIELNTLWQIPSQETVADFQRRFAELRLQQERTQADLKKLRAESGRTADDSAPQESQDALQILAESKQLSVQRDVIINEWLDELSQPLIAASISVEQQQERLSELKRIAESTDRTRSELLECAEALAADSQRRQLEEQKAEAIASCEEILTQSSKQQSELIATWEQLWQELPVSPSDADTMLAWVGDFWQWQTRADRLTALRRELHVARGLARSARGQVLDSWPTNVSESIALETLSQNVQRWQKRQVELQNASERSLAAKATIDRLMVKRAQLEEAQQKVLTKYQAWLDNLPVTEEWPIGKVGELIDSLKRIQREHVAVQDAQTQITAINSSLERFCAAVAELAKEVQADGDLSQPEHLAQAWLESLHELRKERTQRIKLSSQISHRSQRLEEVTSRLEQVDARLAALCSVSQSGNVADVTQLVERVRAAESLRSQIAETTASLRSYCGNDSLSAFLESLASSDTADLEFEVSESSANLIKLDDQRKETDREIGSLLQQIEQLASSQESMRNAQILQNQRGELAELAQQWVVERLAQELLSRTIEQFASEHEPELLRLTRRYLSQLTGGRYRSVEHDKTGSGQFIVRDDREVAFPPDRLSTGTREQLYLAIRMAFVTHHACEHEPLPVLMDDCFVNFDDHRTSLALEAIADWDDGLQSIILSCHSRVVHRMADIAPETPVIHLDRDITTTARRLAGELSAMAERVEP